eukprot:maker-scaffold275_size226830-snap-gene-1.23 protein:Tk00630 transcript:maker-scaffold275_size226830-snap-gene-1.23-mRNA-1 annotation:"hypothetical protein CSUB01_00856"
MTLKSWFQRKFQNKSASYDLGVEQDGKMPEVLSEADLVKKTRSSKSYATGAGRLEWGEGIPVKIDKEMMKEAERSMRIITTKGDVVDDDEDD